MQMLCYKCKHSWNYKGKNSEGKGYITCPGCLYKIRVDKALVEGPLRQELLTNLPKKRSLPIKLPTKLPSFNVEIPTTNTFPKEEMPAPGIKSEEEPIIRILPPKFEIIRVIPYDPIKHLEHQRSFFF